ncbi:Transcriptional regulator, MerR family OS=Tsukamurella paurometabola (strain ATCC 8368 / DSM/ CCUG 35730 / CIP 100753 / JCM 10117 / KCTC 9821 / NBRC 16120/ NCIMB 702349 / NCTC 13040) OX=521096 GN=Tpau_1388 PE=4 SV=1 [Tsukamurella paurometabola]|uniref:Transcriptional regulator, MerR family n=1 Tax=Tsukamurella paurometabola (strain ATCC 8368 / DSM 20162 / CCUG 35730 / CIP 100753 / JCM 10117 / KCTC 9821 / NBRC 16120 / NCIMB 702349 / NCTC 13040) TaxID=521096 RepID=D5UWZ4_TSUPD|nr:MerR family transcriptional regulator [Tsukamurella paurometabola]ADG78016.1 transcriptional regulator, MerR family [Tsukamurella paurometabola DSM 20162]SUP29794.1 Cd(II)/Pb(II)-responsive transcriptional regulator [Tsukamurella paurometabola]
MKLSELSTETGVSTASLKYYLRESLLAPGDPITRTQSDYGPMHVERVRLIRALADSGGLSLAQIRRVLNALDSPAVARHDMFGVAQEVLVEASPVVDDAEWSALAEGFVRERGWRIQEHDPLIPVLGSQLRALLASCPVSDTDTLDRWADASEMIASADLDVLSDDDAEALKTVIVGTVLSDKVLQTLRRLAQQDRSARLHDDARTSHAGQTSSDGPASRR